METGSRNQDSSAAGADSHPHPRTSRLCQRMCSKITRLQIPNRNDVFEKFNEATGEPGSPLDGYETAEETFLTEQDFTHPKVNLFDEDQEEEYSEPIIPKEKIMMRINSHKGMNSYQLAHQLSCKWTTGAGPRIGCMRDYPSELQCRVMEQVNLSPYPTRSALSTPSSTPHPTRFCPKILIPTSRIERYSSQSGLASEQGNIAIHSNTSSY